ncbi:MAG: hypothetical protein M0P43_04625 [Arcobacteraceae bacterium]|nr:hypothetical protein [Arcobacteraceae bacterium]MDY0327995.1 hypothetical protein [Arcobacteraceae bacterium]
MQIEHLETFGTIVICDCSETSISDAIEILQHTDLPYPKAKKLVTKCSRTCCDKPLRLLFNMVEFGKFDLEEVANLIKK